MRSLGILIAWGLICLFGLGRALAEDLKAEATLPRTLQELNRWYAEPRTNGATYFLKAYEVLTNNLPQAHYTNANGGIGGAYPIWPDVEVPVANAPLTPASKSSLAPLLRAMNKAWPLLEQGAACERSRYPVDFTEGWDAPLRHLTEVSGDMMGCYYRAISEADGREGSAAAASILMALKVEQSLKAEPLIVSQESRIRYQGLAIDGLEQVLNRVAPPPDALEELQNVFNRLEMEEAGGESFRRAWLGDKLMMSAWLDLSSNRLYKIATELTNYWSGTADSTNFTMEQVPLLIAKGWQTRSADRGLIEETHDEVLSLWKQGYPKRFEADAIFEARVSDLARRQLVFVPIKANFRGIAEQEGVAIVRLRLSQTAVALERYRAAHENQYPDSLSVLVPKYLPAVPEDLFADAPLQYRRRGNGYVLYSAGKNRRDDGGSRKTDLVFEMIHPPGRAIIE